MPASRGDHSHTPSPRLHPAQYAGKNARDRSVVESRKSQQITGDENGGVSDATRRPSKTESAMDALRQNPALSAAKTGTESDSAIDDEHDSESNMENDDETDGAEQPGHESIPPAPEDFTPFYTLIADPITGEYAHPTVHYVFADDDPDILTNAFLANDEEALPANAGSAREERFVIVDMDADGKQVLSATSLTPQWQALRTTLGPAPSWRGGVEQGGTDKGLMLKITGQEAFNRSVAARPQKTRATSSIRDIESLMKEFDKRLKDLDTVLGNTGHTEAAAHALVT